MALGTLDGVEGQKRIHELHYLQILIGHFMSGVVRLLTMASFTTIFIPFPSPSVRDILQIAPGVDEWATGPRREVEKV